MKRLFWFLLIITLLMGMGGRQRGFAFSTENVGVRTGDRIIHELVRYTSSSEDERRQLGVIEITEVTHIPSNIGEGNDTIITSFERKYMGNSLDYFENRKNNMSQFGSVIIHTNWTYWKNNFGSLYLNDTGLDSILLLNFTESMDTISFSARDTLDQSNSSHKIDFVIGFDFTYEKQTGILEEFSWFNAHNSTDDDIINYELKFDIKFERILNEPNFAISNNDGINMKMSIQFIMLTIIWITKFNRKIFRRQLQNR